MIDWDIATKSSKYENEGKYFLNKSWFERKTSEIKSEIEN
jgi:hypothetical protein